MTEPKTDIAPHRRLNPLTGRWVVVSPQRNQRPWRGTVELEPVSRGPSHDPGCYLCPGARRVTGETNPVYEGVYVFANDFPAVLESPTQTRADSDPLLQSEPVSGVCRVICFSPDHSATMADLSVAEIAAVVRTWVEQSAELGTRYPSVQVFENKGAMMGCSNPHPHGQVWATSFIPSELEEEDRRQRHWFVRHQRPMLADLVEREMEIGERVVVKTERWVALVPYWAAWPFETLVLPRFAAQRLSDLSPPDQADLAVLLKRLTIAYDALFGCSFPYSMGWHGAPYTAKTAEPWRLHAHFYPPLLRSASVRKFMVGFEMLGEAQRDLTPEQAAQQLRQAGAGLWEHL